jgi:DnaK suppressor protein
VEESTARDLLAAERETTLGRIAAMSIDLEGIVAASADSNNDDEHDPEGSTVAFERAQVAALLLEAKAYLEELDQALARLTAGSYWSCELCGTAIGSERLAARPAARTCIGCATPGRHTF